MDEINRPSKERYYQTVARNLFLNEEFFKIFEAFSKANIPLIPLKGIALIQNVYSDIGARFIGDIDILIKAEDVPKAACLLQGLAYSSPTSYFNPKRPYSIYLNSLPFSKPTEIVYFVHLHWHLVNATLPLFMYRINMAEIWKEAKMEECKGKNILMMAPHHLITYLSIHALNHSFNKISLFCDIQKVIEFYKDRFDWQEVIEIARVWNAWLPLYYSLYFASKILHVDLPLDLLNILKPKKISKAEEGIISSILKNRFGSLNLIYPLYLKMAGGILNKLKFIFLSIFIPPGQLALIDSVKYKYLIFLYYFRRLGWGFAQAIVLFRKLSAGGRSPRGHPTIF